MKIVLHAAQDTEPVVGALNMPLVYPGGDDSELRSEVLPAPGADGLLATLDGREQRITDPAALVDALNQQTPQARIDFDHQTEPTSHTYRGSSAAEGWASEYQLEPNGAISALLKLREWAMHRVRSREYRYLSAAVMMMRDTKEIVGMSSVSLLNNPNLMVPALNAQAAATPPTAATPPASEDLVARETKVAAREQAAQTLLTNAATRAVDAAVAAKRLLPAQKDFALAAVLNHADGVEKGLDAFEAAYPGEVAALQTLDTRIGPQGQPAGAAEAPRFHATAGRPVDQDQLQRHAQVAQHACDRKISYRDAVLELGAMM